MCCKVLVRRSGQRSGSEKRVYGATEREWLYWYDENKVRYLTQMERADEEAKKADAELAVRVAVQKENSILRERLKALGIDPGALAWPLGTRID
jgi:hypothetical protein